MANEKADEPKVLDAERMVPDTTTGFENMLQDLVIAKIDPEAAVAQFAATAKALAQLVPATIKQTKPQDWVQMGKGVYLQGTGADRVAILWGIVFGEPRIERVQLEGGHFKFVVSGPMMSQLAYRLTGGGVFQSIFGSRASTDPFFRPGGRDGVDENGVITRGEFEGQVFSPGKHIDEGDVRKAAWENWKARGVSMICGLRNLTPADLAAADVKAGSSVEYGKGGKGGTTVTADIKAQQVKLGNEVLKKAGGDVETAREIMRSITAGDKPGKDGKIFPGFDSAKRLTQDWQLEKAFKKLAEFKSSPMESSGDEEDTFDG